MQPGGWADTTLLIGRTGFFNIIKERWAQYNVIEHGNVLNDMKRRGVDDPDALPNYHYRDDSKLLWNAIHKYVTQVVNGVYGT